MPEYSKLPLKVPRPLNAVIVDFINFTMKVDAVRGASNII